jgi:hypothetical protein
MTDNGSGGPCHGVAGILQAYANTLRSVQLSGPTLFTQIIQQAAATAASAGVHQVCVPHIWCSSVLGLRLSYVCPVCAVGGGSRAVSCSHMRVRPRAQGNQKYFVLLIITDGVINDVESTIASLVAAADLPLSVLIVGVGNADFTQMEVLDGDKRRLSSQGRVAQRDIVQFVPMREFVTGGVLSPDAGAALTRSLLAEIPEQVCSYFSMAHIMPNPRVAAVVPPPAAGGKAPTTPIRRPCRACCTPTPAGVCVLILSIALCLVGVPDTCAASSAPFLFFSHRPVCVVGGT